MTWREAGDADVPLLARWNAELVEDERARTALDLGGFAARMRGFLSGEYRAVIFEDDAAPVAYALFEPEPDAGDPGRIHLRQLFVAREARRRGIGTRAVALLFGEIWPRGARVTVDVLAWNEPALAFWRAAGFGEYSVRLERKPGSGDGGRPR